MRSTDARASLDVVKITHNVYPRFSFKVGGPELLPANLDIKFREEARGDGAPIDHDPVVLELTTLDGLERNCYLFAPGAKQALVAQLTGGIVLPERDQPTG